MRRRRHLPTISSSSYHKVTICLSGNVETHFQGTKDNRWKSLDLLFETARYHCSMKPPVRSMVLLKERFKKLSITQEKGEERSLWHIDYLLPRTQNEL